MCGLCGFLGVEHWTEKAVPGPAGDADAPQASARRRERQYRVRFIDTVLRPYGLRLQDWQRQSFLLSNRTGRTEVVDNPIALWAMAEKMAGRPLDPLDPALLDRLESRAEAG